MTTVLAVFLALPLAAALAQKPAAPPSPPPAAGAPPAAAAPSGPPTPPPEAKSLEAFVGNWKGTVEGTVMGQASKGPATYKCVKAAGGFGVSCAGKFKLKGLPDQEILSLYGYDAGTRTYHWYAITNMGEVHDHIGSVSGDTWTFQHEGKAPDGKAIVERVTTSLKGPREINFKSVTTTGGQEMANITGTFKK